MDSTAGFVTLMVLFLLVAIGVAWHFRRSRSLLEQWANRNGYRIISGEYRRVFRGPFFWTTSKAQTIYRVALEVKCDVRTGRVRCGSWWLGLMSDKVEVRKDEAPARTPDPMHDRWFDG